MGKLVNANFSRLWRSRTFGFYIISMIAFASAFMAMQAFAMDYTVPLSRVIFLPLSLYGIVSAAFVSVFVGTDFSDGVVRNKLLAGNRRRDFVISHILVSCVSCICVYVIVSLFTLAVGKFIFENNVETDALIFHFLLGIGMSGAVGCLFCVITLSCGSKTNAVIWCMGIAFGLMFLSMHTNQQLVQTEFQDGLPNPHYISGVRRMLYGFLHDLNPYGQAVQLTVWEVWNPIRAVICDLVWIVVGTFAGCSVFRRKDIR